MKKQILLLLILAASCAASCSSAQTVKNAPSSKFAVEIKTLLQKQLLLTNAAEFTGIRTLKGGSGFLINYNDATYAVTAKHLLGEAGGIEPEVSATALDKNLLSWQMSPRVVADAAKETINLNAKNLDYSQSEADILLLNVASKTFNLGILAPNFALPAIGEKLFLIGCPYSETGCKQNFYELKFAEFDQKEALLFCEMNAKVDLRGFSGAPVVNGNGEAVGVLVSSAEADGKVYAAVTHIKEIQKIK